MIRLSDEHWERIRDHFPEEHIADGRPGRKLVPTRRVLEAVLWILNTGAQWHILLHDKAPEKRRPLLSFQVLRNALEVLPASAFQDKAGFVPQMLGGLDVVLDDKRAVAQPARPQGSAGPTPIRNRRAANSGSATRLYQGAPRLTTSPLASWTRSG